MMSDRLIIDIGSSAGAGDGDDLRVAFDKTNKNFANIWAGNVTTANAQVYSVAGRQGNVTLTYLDVTGVASLANVTQLQIQMAANSAADRAYTDSVVGNLALVTIPNVTITGGNISNVRLSGSTYGNVANLNVEGLLTVNTLEVGPGGLTVPDGNFVLANGSLTADSITFGDGTTMSTVVNLAPTNSAIAAVQANVTAANAAIAGIRANVEAANASVIAANIRITNLESNASTQADALSALVTANTVQANKLNTLTTLTSAQAININELRANITAANAVSESNFASLTSNAAAQAVAINLLNANVAAANAAITAINAGSGLTAANAAIASLQANVAAANATISTLSSTTTANAAAQQISINDLISNAAVQGVAINRINANIAAANAAIAAANLTIANVQIDALRANVEAANVAIASVSSAWQANAATQAALIDALNTNAAAQAGTLNTLTANASVQSAEISALRANVTAANAAIAAIVVPNLSGNVATGNVSGFHGNFSTVSGTLLTSAQPNITTVGNLTSLTVEGNVVAQGVIAGILVGSLRTGNQPNITGVGTLNSLTVTGNVATGNVSGATGQFTHVTGTLTTAAQPNITSVGTLTAVSVTGNVTAGNVNLDGNLSAFRVTASNGIFGTVFTGSQPNITRVGTLSNLAVSANANVGNLNANGTVVATNLVGTLLTPTQTNITTIGTLGNLTIANDLVIGGNITTGANTFITVKEGYAEIFAATVITGTILNGFIANALQPNITTVGTLTGLTVDGASRVNSIVSNTTANAVTFYGNVIGTTGQFSGNIASGNVVTGQVNASGNVNAANLNVASNVYVQNVLLASTGVFGNVAGTLLTNLQPFINTLGTLTELRVDGPVEITGTQFVTDDLYITGNLFVNGNTTTVSAGNVTTNDKDLTLANNAVNSTAARGSGIYIGPNGAYGSFYIYDDTWTTANALSVTGNVTTGNVSGDTGAFTNIRGTILDPVQTNITTIGTLNALTVSGGITGTLLTNAQPFIEQIGTLPNLSVTGNVTTGNVSGDTGTFTNVRGTILDPVQTNITTVGTLDTLSVTGNVSSANVNTGLVTASHVRGTLLTNAQPNITSIGNLVSLNVDGVVTASGFNFSGIGSSFAIANLNVTANADINNLNVSGAANLGLISGTLMTNAQPNINSVGTLDTLDVTGNVTTGNVSGATGTFTNVTVVSQLTADHAVFAGNVTTGNVSGATGTFTDIRGTILDSVQTAITTVGTLNTLDVAGNATVGNISTTTGEFDNIVSTQATLDTLSVTSNVTTGNVSGATGTFTNIRGTILDSIQTAITTVGTLVEVVTTGNVSATGNVTADNLVATGNIYGQLAAGPQTGITAIGNLANITVTGTVTGNVSATLLGGFLTTALQPNITQVGVLNTLTVVGNIQTQAVDATNARFIELQGVLLTNTQPHINTIGTLTSLNTTGNVTSANLTTGNISASGTIVSGSDIIAAGNLQITNVNATGNIVATNANISGDISAANIIAANLDITNLSVSGTANVIGDISGGNVVTSGNLTVNGSNIFAVTSNLQVLSLAATEALATNVRIIGTTDSVNPITGALVVTGGIGANTIWTGDYAVIAGNITTGSNLRVADNAYFANSVYLFDSSGVSTGIFSNVGNVQLFPSTTTLLEIGGEATTVNIGAISGFGNTTIRNDLTIEGGLFLNGGWGEVGIGNVIINNDLQANNIFLASSLYLGGGINANAGMTINGGITANGNIVVGGNVTDVNNLVANTAAIARWVNIGDQIVVGNAGAGSQTLRNNFSTGALQVRGGTGILGNLTVGVPNNSNANVVIHSLTPTTGANTGALQVSGGISTLGNLFVQGEATIVGNVNFTAFLAASINGTPIGNATPSSAVFTTLALANVRPAQRPTISFDFSNSRKLDPILSYSRTGDATYFDNQGNLRIAKAHVVRFTHDPETLRSMGVMIEESRTNVFRESNGFANATAYATLNSTVSVATNTDSPDGNYNAYRIVDDATNSVHGIYHQAAYQPTFTLGAFYTASAFVKPDEIDQCSLIFFGEGPATIFDLSLGQVVSEGASYRSSIKTLANGWYRVQSTVQKTNTSGNVVLALADGGTVTFLGTGSQGLSTYGLQCELGAFATSYIPTTTIANTRGTDTLSITSTEFFRRYNSQENTVLVDSRLDYRTTTAVTNFQRSTVVSFSDGTADNRISLLVENRNAPVDRTANLVIYTSGVLQTNANIATANLTSVTTNSKMAVFFKQGYHGTAFNGNGNVISSSGNISSTITQMTIGSGPGTGALNGTVSKLAVYSGVVLGDELYTLTQ